MMGTGVAVNLEDITKLNNLRMSLPPVWYGEEGHFPAAILGIPSEFKSNEKVSFRFPHLDEVRD